MDLQLLTIKDIAKELKVSERTAKRINLDIKQEFGTKTKITKEHLINYLKLSNLNG